MMSMYNKILVPLDGSHLSELALPHAEGLARCFGSEVLLVRVYQPISVPFDLYTLGPDVIDNYNKELQAQLEGDVKRYLLHIQKRLQLESIKSRIFVLGGIVTEAILEIAETEAVDLIVMSTHGRSGLSRWVYGSVASKVLQAASCPVFLVRAKQTQVESSTSA